MKTFEINPDTFLVQNLSEATGGVKHRTVGNEREERDGERVSVERHTLKTIDHESIVKDLNSLAITHVNYLIRRHCVRTPIGWVTNATGLKQLEEKLRPIAEQVHALNQSASVVGSNHRGTVGIFPIALASNLEGAALQIRRAVTGRLQEARERVLAGETIRDVVVAPIKTLPGLLTSVPAALVQAAVDALDDAVKGARKTKQDGGDLTTYLANLDLSVVEDAINVVGWQDLVDGNETANAA